MKTKSGVYSETADVRVHVCPVAREIYVMPSAGARMACDEALRKGLNLVEAHQPGWGAPTAVGYLVSPQDIPGCVRLVIRDKCWDRYRFQGNLSDKGLVAETMVLDLLREGLIPLGRGSVQCVVKIQRNTPENIRGQDAVVEMGGRVTVQTKLDHKGGSKGAGGTGNLYLQVDEINPMQLV